MLLLRQHLVPRQATKELHCVLFIPPSYNTFFGANMGFSICSLHSRLVVDWPLLFRSVFVDQEMHIIQCPAKDQLIGSRPSIRPTSVWCMSLGTEWSRRSDA